jgi:hypothetical protein
VSAVCDLLQLEFAIQRVVIPQGITLTLKNLGLGRARRTSGQGIPFFAGAHSCYPVIGLLEICWLAVMASALRACIASLHVGCTRHIHNASLGLICVALYAGDSSALEHLNSINAVFGLEHGVLCGR